MSSPSMNKISSTPGEGALHEGTVKWYSVAFGYGFLKSDDGDAQDKRAEVEGDPDRADDSRDVFVHHSVLGDREDLSYGERVRFEVVEGPKGLMATRLERVESGR